MRVARVHSVALRVGALVVAAALAACRVLPAGGPSSGDIRAGATTGIRVINVDDAVARGLQERRSAQPFAELFPSAPAASQIVRPGDVLEISVWEAPPTVLFSTGGGSAALVQGASISGSGSGTTSNVTTLPQQMVDAVGTVYVPFAGQIAVGGKTLPEIEAEITHQLQGKANRPQVLVRLAANNTAYATIVGEVVSSTRMSLTPRGERVLDALAAAGGTKEPVEKITLQLTRGSTVHALPLDTIIRDPRQNVALQPGDVVTALYQPLSFTALGATGKNDEINFEAKGISLAQALARAGALLDSRASAEGVFIFRLESSAPSEATTAAAPAEPTPVIYHIDFKDPKALFLVQNFPMENRDVLYVANAPGAQLQKFLNLLVSTIYPIQGVITLTK